MVASLDHLLPSAAARGAPCHLRSDDGLPLVGTVTFDSTIVRDAEYGDLYELARHELAHALGFSGVLFGPWVEPPFAREQRFIGARAGAAWQRAGGEGAPPLRDGAHWDPAHFGWELMIAGAVSEGIPASTVTLEVFADLGYTVDLSLAEHWAPGNNFPPAP